MGEKMTGDEFKELRKAMGMTQDQVAEWLTKETGKFVSQPTVCGWEVGRTKIPLPGLIRNMMQQRIAQSA